MSIYSLDNFRTQCNAINCGHCVVQHASKIFRAIIILPEEEKVLPITPWRHAFLSLGIVLLSSQWRVSPCWVWQHKPFVQLLRRLRQEGGLSPGVPGQTGDSVGHPSPTKTEQNSPLKRRLCYQSSFLSALYICIYTWNHMIEALTPW